MKKTVTSALALTAILASGVAYAITTVNPDTPVLELTASTPADGETLPGLFAGDVISITPANFAQNPEMYIEYEIEGNESGDWEIVKSNSWTNRDEEMGCYTATIYGDYVMYDGVDYRIVYKAYADEMSCNYGEDPIGQAIVNLKGSTPAYEYSPYTLESYSPQDSGNDVLAEVGTLPNNCPYISMTFSGPVKIGKAGYLLGSGAGISSFGPVEAAGEVETIDGVEYSNEWHLTFREGYLESQTAPIIVAVFATDAEGRVVKGNVGEKEYSCFQFYYNVEGMYKQLSYDFGTEPLVAVANVTASYPGYPLNNSWMTAAPIVTKNGEKVADVVDCISIFPPGTDPDELDVQSTGVMMVFDTILTEPGTYTLEMPRGYLNIGTEFLGYYQAEDNVEFTIESGAAADVLPAPGVVTELSSFDIQYDVDGELAIDAEAAHPYLYLASENMSSSKWASVSVMGNTLSLALTGTISDIDTYTLVIPTGYLTLDGEALPGFTAEYIIKAAEEEKCPAVFTPAAGAVEVLPAQIDIVFPDYSEVGSASGKATMTVNDGEPVALGDAEFGEEWNEMIQPLGEFAGMTEEGTYTITFPAGYFMMNEKASPEMTVTYTIGGTPAEPEYPAVFTPAPGAVEMMPAQIDFAFTAYDEWMQGSGKATIQFNDEEPVALGDTEYDWNAPENEGWQPLGEFAGKTDKGTYTVTFPEGYFQLGSNGVASEKIVLVYTIGIDTGVELVGIQADRYVVYNMNGVKVLDTKNADDLKTLKGLYIVNGLKIVLK